MGGSAGTRGRWHIALRGGQDGQPMDAYLLDAVRTPFGRFRGGLSGVRTDDLAAAPITELLAPPPRARPRARSTT